MKVVAGVDWSDAAFAAVEQLGMLYRPAEVTLVHGVIRHTAAKGPMTV